MSANGAGTGRGRRTRDDAPARDSFRREPLEAEAPAPVEVMPPPVAREEFPVQAERADSLPSAEEVAGREEFLSPFEDELDVPTFLRRGKKESKGEEDRDVPAFLRRSAD